ncbi:MAG: hypothetical protein V1926_05515 [Candidatus Peregrinibacteria bacterium]
MLNVYESSSAPTVGKFRSVQFLSSDKSRAFMLQYTGRDPSYTEQVDVFDDIVGSFGFVLD